MSAPLMPADRWGERLIRRLGLWSAVAVLVGSTIGSGIFRTPAGVARLVDDVPLFPARVGRGRRGGVVRRAHLLGARSRVSPLGRRLRLRARVLRAAAGVPFHLGGAARDSAGRVWCDRYHRIGIHAAHPGPRSRRRHGASGPALDQRRAAARRRVHRARRHRQLFRDSPRGGGAESEHHSEGRGARGAGDCRPSRWATPTPQSPT